MDTETKQFKYYLKNGVEASYAYSSGGSILSIIYELVNDYAAAVGTFHIPEAIFLRLDVHVSLRKEVNETRRLVDFSGFGMDSLRIDTVHGSVRIIPKYKMSWPIFYGSLEELQECEATQLFDNLLEQ